MMSFKDFKSIERRSASDDVTRCYCSDTSPASTKGEDK
jgi:hypothetical protein